MKKWVFNLLWVVVVFLSCNTLFAQDPQFSQYYAAPLYLNPGLTGLNQMGSAGINYRSQWPNIESNFETYSFYIDYNFEDYYSSGGLMVNTDQEGLVGLRSTSISLLYAYQVQLNYQWTFRPGVEISYYMRDLNFDKLTFGDQFDDTGLVNPSTAETFNTGLQARFFDISLGGIVFTENIWLGYATHHVTQPNQSIAGGDSPLKRRISVHGGYKIPLSKLFPLMARSERAERSLTPTLNYRAQGKFDQLDAGMYLTFDPILFGMWYRGVPIKTLKGTPNNEALITMVGVKAGNTTFGYSFDLTLSDLGVDSGGAHELSITYNFTLTPLKPAREVRELKCPVPFIF